MIGLRKGDILHSDAQALVNTVNCVGIMGRGIALQFKKAFPENFKFYERACERGEVRLGSVLVYDTGRLTGPRYIINFPTKKHWKSKSRLEDIEKGLQALVRTVRQLDIQTVAIPPLGCGLGGLKWSAVRRRIESAFEVVPEVEVMLFEPSGAPEAAEMVKQARAPEMTIGRAALLALMRRYLAAVMDPFVSLLEIHKLMYFLQEAGEGLKLKYKKAPYGPYATNLRHVLTAIEGHFVVGYGDAEDNPDRPLELKEEAAETAKDFLAKHPGTLRRFDRVVNLIEGFETPFGMELLATVHWVAAHEGAQALPEAIRKTYAWNERKRAFSEKHIAIAWNVLHRKGWLHPAGAERAD
jgi:O-acetyl-ADP-ribose deacetylase (regulator of RNase III)